MGNHLFGSDPDWHMKHEFWLVILHPFNFHVWVWAYWIGPDDIWPYLIWHLSNHDITWLIVIYQPSHLWLGPFGPRNSHFIWTYNKFINYHIGCTLHHHLSLILSIPVPIIHLFYQSPSFVPCTNRVNPMTLIGVGFILDIGYCPISIGK